VISSHIFYAPVKVAVVSKSWWDCVFGWSASDLHLFSNLLISSTFFQQPTLDHCQQECLLPSKYCLVPDTRIQDYSQDLGSKAEEVREEQVPTEPDIISFLGSGAAAAAGRPEVLLDLVTVILRTGCN